jgi:hypothetical protein
VQARSFLWKVGEHVVAGKETLKFGSIFGSLPDFLSLRPVFTMCGQPCGYGKYSSLSKINRQWRKWRALAKSLTLITKSVHTGGHTKKRLGQPETARVVEITPVVLEYCLNQIFFEIIMEYDVKWSLTVSLNVQVMY